MNQANLIDQISIHQGIQISVAVHNPPHRVKLGYRRLVL